MKLILTQNEAIERLRHFLQIKEDCQLIISRPRPKTPPKPKTKPVTDTRTPHRLVFEQIEALDYTGKDKIQCIKILRENFNLSLAQAKCIVEQWRTNYCRDVFRDARQSVSFYDLAGEYKEISLVPR